MVLLPVGGRGKAEEEGLVCGISRGSMETGHEFPGVCCLQCPPYSSLFPPSPYFSLPIQVAPSSAKDLVISFMSSKIELCGSGIRGL